MDTLCMLINVISSQIGTRRETAIFMGILTSNKRKDMLGQICHKLSSNCNSFGCSGWFSI